jgi:hypothetical protein
MVEEYKVIVIGTVSDILSAGRSIARQKYYAR